MYNDTYLLTSESKSIFNLTDNMNVKQFPPGSTWSSLEPTKWPTSWPTKWPTDWPTKSPTQWPTKWPTDWPS